MGLGVASDLNILLTIVVDATLLLASPSVRSRVVISDTDIIGTYTSLDQIPLYAGGTNTTYRRMPDGVRSGKCLPYFSNIPTVYWDYFVNMNINCINEGMAEANETSLANYLNYC